MTNDIFSCYLPLIDAEMQRVIGRAEGAYAGHYGMLRYHMGWVDPLLQPAVVNSGKRIRPVACLLACKAVGGVVEDALPLAAAVELLHNFSLIHDDVEDDSPTRRHRPTVWALWGVPQAINAGDAMFTLARLALHGLGSRPIPPDKAMDACMIFDYACLRLTEGQYLDMSFEGRLDVAVDEYLLMIEGKTAALLSASLELGALVGGADLATRQHLAEFGRSLGLAFQMEDDILGIWGDEAVTGKSAASDILARKKSLPVVYALENPLVGEELRARYAQPIEPAGVPAVLDLLVQAGAQAYARQAAHAAHQAAIQALHASGVLADGNQAGETLLEVAEMLLGRQS
ncbi:MAG TPA: polyprenyl synthetase family protein [Anaerolineae bacterium]|nr:polyprenyl synthetase family protein [Anaerolineae bacterium]